MIIVEKESPDLHVYEAERCCFCREPTRTWCKVKDVACCETCANKANLEDVPSKKEWLRRERIAHRDFSAPVPKKEASWLDALFDHHFN